MGAAGDMLNASLLDFLDDAEAFVSEFNEIGIPDVKAKLIKDEKCGIHGSRFVVEAAGEVEGEENEHHHGEHHHAHRSMADIESTINSLRISKTVKENVLTVYNLLAKAESKVHGTTVTEIHFHEIGMLDAIADITLFSMIIEKIKPERIVVSPVCVGRGKVKCAHGVLPVPAPATAELLKGIPIYGSDFDGELCTPTGAALIRHFANEFSSMPVMTVEKIGIGIGKKDFPAANIIRAFLSNTGNSGDVVEFTASVDDMTGEELGAAVKLLLDGGALEAYTTPLTMKKSRPGVLFTVISRPEDSEKIAKLIFTHTTTIGIRKSIKNRLTLERRIETVETPFGSVRLKISEGLGVKKAKLEYEDLFRLASENGKSVSQMRHLIEKNI